MRLRTVLSVAFLAVIPTMALAQSGLDEPPPILGGTPAADAFNEALGQVRGGTPDAPPPASAATSQTIGFTVSDELRATLGEALYADYLATLEFNRRVFEWQLASSRAIFWVVLGLVITGVAFAAIQFIKAMRAPPATDPAARAAQLTELELTGKGVKVSSPVLGVIILVISLGFFYLFLVHVYPVEHVRPGVDTPPPSASAD